MLRTEARSPAATPIVGGFVLVPVRSILAAWLGCQGIELGVGHFRAWLGCHEIRHRRHFSPAGTRAAHGLDELAALLDIGPKRARLLARDLVAAGLLGWSESDLSFPEPSPLPGDLLGPFADTIGRGEGSLAVPRRLLRFLARGASAARIAVALAALFRCLSCRRGNPAGRGRLKASWIVRAFRVGKRQVVAARAELVELGWLILEGDDPQRVMNRWGRAYRIDLGWIAPARPIARSAPPSPIPAPPSAPPLTDRTPLREGIQNQNPAPGGPAGIQPSAGEGRAEAPARPGTSAVARPMIPPPPSAPMVPASTAPARPPTLAATSTEPAAGSPAICPAARPASTSGPSPSAPGPAPARGPLTAPRLEDVRVEDLKDGGRLMDLLGQAVARGLVIGSEADRLRFVGAAEHALAIGKKNPAGLFMYLVRGRLWHHLTQADEDRANGRIKAFLRGPGRPAMESSSSRRPARPGLSDDALLARRVRAALASAGYRGDPFPQVRRLDQGWTRARWDAALGELDGA